MEQKPYDHKQVEKKWQEKWAKDKTYQPDLKNAKKPFYNLMMFPYPSAEGLHVGNMYAFTGADVYGRFQRMQGNDVFEPIGLDGFGIHSENYALKIGKHPKEQAKISEKHFYDQLHAIGNGFAWDNKLETYDPHYYTWTQWLFVQMYKNGLACRGKAMVNWCPKDKTVLADEQVEGGVCERCKTPVQRREMEQWFFKITKYADKLLAGIEKIKWPEKIKIAQRQWIGKKEGAEITFKLSIPGQKEGKHRVTVFTTRLDTIFGVTFITVSPELAKKWLAVGLEAPAEVEKYVQDSLVKTDQERLATAGEKTGVFTQVYAMNPVNNEKVPVWVADYVLGDVGTGAVMGVPAHDERDFEFAKKHALPIKPVIKPIFKQDERDKEQEKLLKEILTVAQKEEKQIIITGGWVLDVHYGERMRNHSDVDINVPYEDVEFWKQYFIKKQFKQKYLVPNADERYYVEFEGENTWIDIDGFRINEDGYFCTKSSGKEEPDFKEEDAIKKGKLLGFDVEYMSPAHKIEAILWCRREGKGNFPGKDLSKYDLDLELLGEQVSDRKEILFQSGKYSGLTSEEAIQKIAQDFDSIKKSYNYHLRDWLISRQRYWGPPIPMVHCKKCGWQPVDEKDLPVLLPDIEDWQPKGDGKGPLEKAPKEWLFTTCPTCGGEAKRETDVSDTFLDSSWYFLRYPSIHADASDENPFDLTISQKWLPVNAYIGGAEHAVLHLLYSRFVWMALRDWGFLKGIESTEPFPFLFSHGLLIKDGAKMSKSRGNVIIPDKYIVTHGADTLRMYLMFLGPYDQGGDFRDTGIASMKRFLDRVWHLMTDEKKIGSKTSERIKTKLHQTIKDMSRDVSQFKYNTALARFMELVNVWKEEGESLSREDGLSAFKLIAPFAPHMTEELFQKIKRSKDQKIKSIHLESWPEYDESLIQYDTVTIVVQVNGKVRDTISVKNQVSSVKKKVIAELNKSERVQHVLQGKKIKNTIFVPGRLVNFVV